MAVGDLPGWGIQRGNGPTPEAAFRVPIWLAAGQLAVTASASEQRGTPPSLASRPWGRWTSREAGLASPSWRVRVIVKGVKAPAAKLSGPAERVGEKTPLLQPLTICIGVSPMVRALPDQGVNS